MGCGSILDGVFNHCGRGFWPFHHVLENGAASPYRDWFHLDPAVLAGRVGLNAYPDRGGASGGAPLGYRAWWGLPALPKFNVDNPPTREYLLGVGEHWLRFGIDGWRLDVPGEIDDRAFWQEFRRALPGGRTARPTSSASSGTRRPSGSRATGSTRQMNYPLGTAILGFAGGGHLDLRRHRAATTRTGGCSTRSTGRRSAAGSRR